MPPPTPNPPPVVVAPHPTPVAPPEPEAPAEPPRHETPETIHVHPVRPLPTRSIHTQTERAPTHPQSTQTEGDDVGARVHRQDIDDGPPPGWLPPPRPDPSPVQRPVAPRVVDFAPMVHERAPTDPSPIRADIVEKEHDDTVSSSSVYLPPPADAHTG